MRVCKSLKRLITVLCRNHIVLMSDIACANILGPHGNFMGLMHKLTGNIGNLFRHGCTEQPGVFVLWRKR